jgi:bacterial/archaeal transporter family-2 protein
LSPAGCPFPARVAPAEAPLAFAGLTIAANILMSLAIDKFGWFGMDVYPLSGWRLLGAAFMVDGIALIAKF